MTTQGTIRIGPYDLSYPCRVMTGAKPPYAPADHFWVSHEGSEGMSVSPERMEKLFDELWRDF